jgi:hypothetical protein
MNCANICFSMYACSCIGSRICLQHPVGVTLPKDVVRQEANCVYRTGAIKPGGGRGVGGGDTPSKPESS